MPLPRLNSEFNVVMDPETKFLDSGKTMLKLRVVAKTRKKVDGAWVDGDASFFNIVVWDPFATNLIEAGVSKGDTVFVSGKLRERTHEKDGEKRSTVEISVGDQDDSIGLSARWGRSLRAWVALRRTSHQRRPLLAQPTIGSKMLPLSERADITAVLGHLDLASQLLDRLDYEEFGMAQSHLGDALFELNSWKDNPKFTKRALTQAPRILAGGGESAGSPALTHRKDRNIVYCNHV